MGSIVVIAKDDATMSIIDGQQCITSLTLLLIYLYQAIGVAKGAILQNMIFSDSYGEKSFNIQVPERKDCLDGLYNNNECTPKDIDEDSVRFMADRYNDIKDSFPDDLQGQALESFMYWVINNIVIVKIEAYSVENACEVADAWGDLWESFYDSTESNFEATMKYISKNNLLPKFQKRIEAMLKNTESSGYGFCDAMPDIYWEYASGK